MLDEHFGIGVVEYMVRWPTFLQNTFVCQIIDKRCLNRNASLFLFADLTGRGIGSSGA